MQLGSLDKILISSPGLCIDHFRKIIFMIDQRCIKTELYSCRSLDSLAYNFSAYSIVQCSDTTVSFNEIDANDIVSNNLVDGYYKHES